MLTKLVKVLPLEMRLIIAGATGDIDKTKHLLQHAIDWDNFLRLADYHRVYPSVYATLSRIYNQLVPEYVLDVLRQTCRENSLNALRITGEMVRIGSLLEKQNICAVVLKGAPLSWRLYGDIAVRPYGDIDMLVEADKLEQAITILENEGYRRIQDYDPWNFTPRQLQIYLRRNAYSSHYKYLNSEKNVLLEIHWKLSKYSNVLQFPFEDSTKRIVVAGSLVAVLSDEEWLMYLVLHGAGHKWHRLRWLVDIKKYIQQENIDWESLKSLAERYGIQIFLHQALILVNKLFGVAMPPSFEQDVTRDRIAWRMAALTLQAHILSANDRARGTGAYSFLVSHSYSLYMNRGFKNKLDYIIKTIGPTADDIRFVALPDRLYGLYYIIVPFTSIYRYLRRSIVRNKHG